MKKCFKCSEIKNLSEFYKHNQMADGYLNKCKECTKIDNSLNRQANIEYYREYDRVRGNRQSKDYINQYRKRNSEKDSAHNKINNAVRDGWMDKPNKCDNCQNECDRLHGHHPNYDLPYFVKWLCPACHKLMH